MKASIMFAATGAALAAAGPIANLAKRVMETHVHVEVVTVTVTAGHKPTYAPVEDTQHPPVVEAAQLPNYPPPAPVPAPTYAAPPQPEYSIIPDNDTDDSSNEDDNSSSGAPQYRYPGTATAGVHDDRDFQKAVVDRHNLHRANHSAPAVEWNQDLALAAAYNLQSCQMAHDHVQGMEGYGQNLAFYSGEGDLAEYAVDAISNQWYSEISLYPDGGDYHVWGHFTQVVWKSTRLVGCSARQCSSGRYLTCNYGEAGNRGGAYDENVLPALGHETL